MVQPGQSIFQVAREDGRDAVFDVPAQVLRAAPPDPTITVTLTDDPSVTAKARVRTVDPQADPVTRTFRVRMSLDRSPRGDAAWRDGDGASASWTPARASRFPRAPSPKSTASPPSGSSIPRPRPCPCTMSRCSASIRERSWFREASRAERSSSPPACRRCIRARRSGCSERLLDRPQPFRMGAEASLVHHFPDDRRDGRRPRLLFPARPRRGSALHLPDDDRAGGLARRDRWTTR